MDILKNTSYGMLHGLYDSIKGVVYIFYIDNEINYLNELKKSELEESKQVKTDEYFDIVSENKNAASSVNTNKLKKNKKKIEPKIMKQVFKNCALNGGFTWLSICFFEYLVLPGLQLMLSYWYAERSEELALVWGWLASMLYILFGMMWVLPIFLICKIVSALWFQDIADTVYKLRKGRAQGLPNISKFIADLIFSLVVQALFLVQSMLVNLLPFKYFGKILCFVHLCLLYSLYSFEYKWVNMGWELHKRLSYIESNWPYFIGFGIPLTILCSIPDSIIISGCVFSIFFPIFILSANEAQPNIGASDFALRLFSPVVFVSNMFFNRSVRVTNKPLTTAPSTNVFGSIQQKPQSRHHDPYMQHQGQRSNSARSTSSRNNSRVGTPNTLRVR